MTRRLVITIVATVAATLLLVGVGTLAFATLRARTSTEEDLRELAASINDGLTRTAQISTNRPVLTTAFRRALRVDGIELLAITRAGELVGQLPEGVAPDALDIESLEAGETATGRTGGLVWVADPVTLPPRTVVTVVTREADSGLADAKPWFLLASLLTLGIGAVVAVVLGRRLARPVREADRAARRISSGELSTRLPEPATGHGDELADLARSINAMAASLERSKGLEQQFLLSISHDLRTPLTSIRGYAEAISDGATTDTGHAADVIIRESRRLERLVSDLLDLARLDARAFSLVLAEVDLGPAVLAAARAFEPDASRHGLRVAVSVPHRSVPVRADPDRLSQVLANLLENACKFARAEVRATVRVSDDGTSAAVDVEDDGPGIALEDQPHVFERLYVSSHQPSPNESGSGLGLAIVRQLVELMGGTVHAGTAGPGAGARLSISLPLAAP